jgi:hypothetical protein
MDSAVLQDIQDFVSLRTFSGDINIGNVLHDFAVLLGSLLFGAFIYIVVVRS